MDQPDVQSLRETFIRQGIMLCFNGPFSAALIEEMGRALRIHMQGLDVSQGNVADVFAVYIEIAQNISHYSLSAGLDGMNEQATVIVSRMPDGRYAVSAGNVVRQTDGEALCRRVRELSCMDKDELKSLFKAQMRRPIDPDARSGAGLGLIDMARKASEPLSCTLRPMEGTLAFFNLHVVI